MFSLSRIQFSKFAAMGSLVVLSTLGTPTRADELAQNLGPVGPHEAILTEVGSERVIAFYEPDNGRCAVHAVVFDKTDAHTGMTTAARVRISLEPSQIVHIDSAHNESLKSLDLQCGKNAEELSIIDTDSSVASGITIPQSAPLRPADVKFSRRTSSGIARSPPRIRRSFRSRPEADVQENERQHPRPLGPLC